MIWLPGATATAAAIALLAAVAALWLAPRVRAHQTLALALLAVAAVQGSHYLAVTAADPNEQLQWYRRALFAEGLWPACWMWFSLVYARANRPAGPRPALVALLLAIPPAVLVLLTRQQLLALPPDSLESGRFLVLGNWGQLFTGVVLAGLVAPLVNLVATLRTSAGLGRWQIKFIILGVGFLLGFEIYLLGDRLLFSSVDLWLMGPQALVVALATVLMAVSLMRSRAGSAELTISQPALLGSITLLFVGSYLIALGGLAHLWRLIGGDNADLWQGVLLLVALTGLAALVLSSRVKAEAKRLLARHIYSQRYDYRHEWLQLTERMSRQLSVDGALRVVVGRLFEIFEAPRVSAWLFDEAGRDLRLAATVQVPLDQETAWRAQPLPAPSLAKAMATWEGPRLVAQEADRDVTAQAELRQLVERTRAGMIAPLVTGGRVLGLLAIGQPAVGHYGPEELLLVGTIAQQSATHVLTARLGQELLRTREVELSQLFSTFLVHDLKNLGTALSLVGQNLPHRYTDEQFRNDARHVITETIDKIREMTQKVALLGQPQPTLEAADLNDVARESVAMLNGSLSVPVQCELEPLPPIMLDRRQLRSVFTNLLLNAQEATRAVTLPETGADRVIRLRTHHRDGWAVLLISDTGCGISREFLEQHLFQPFRSTKPGGLGIGLYQCRKIVEAHGGRISVDSHTGKGTSVTVALPAHGR